MQAEGTVLVQNNGILPLAEDIKKVNVFGWASTNWLASGSGSAQTVGIETDLLKALEKAGFSYNRDLAKMYETFMSSNPYKDALHNYAEKTCRLYEPSIHNEKYYSKDLLAKAKEFSDTAIVVLGEYVASNYENVIVLVNNTNQMNLNFLATIEGIDACLVTGTTGINVATAIPALLRGEINPSGRLSDTYAYDFKTSSSYTNSGMEGEGTYLGAGTPRDIFKAIPDSN